MVDVGQAGLKGGAPRHHSPRTRVAQAPPAHAAFGDLFLVVQGGSERLSQSFTDAVVSTYFSNETTSVIAGLMNSMRQAAHAVAVGAGPHDPVETLGATGAVLTADELYIAQLMPSQVYILRDSSLTALPDEPADDRENDPLLGPDAEVDLFRADLHEDDVIVLASTDLRHELTEREIRGLLLGRSAQEAAYDLCALVAQRGGERGEVLVLRVGARQGEVRGPDADVEAGNALVPSDNGRARAAASQRPAVVIREPEWHEPVVADDQEAQQARGPVRRPARTFVQQLAALPLTLLMLLLLLPVLIVRTLSDLVRGGRRVSLPPPPAAPQPDDALADDDWSSLRELRARGPAGARSLRRPGEYLAPGGPPLDLVGAPLSRGNDPLLYRRRRSLPGPGTLLFGFSLVLLVVMAVVLILRNSGEPGEATGEGGEPPAVVTGTAQPNESAAAGAGAATQSSATEAFGEAEARYREALEREPGGNSAATLLILRDAKDLANQALTGDLDRSLAPEINRLLSQIGREEDRLNRVRKLVPSATIGEFESAGVGSALAPLDVRVDAKYVIDAVSGRVVEFATAKQGATVLRKGDVVGTVTVQDPLAVVNRSLSVLVIDSRYNVISLQPEQNPRLLRVAATDRWRSPVAFDNFNNNLYVLDPGANAILKYQWTAGGYEIGPINYLDPRDGVDISEAIGFAIDGDIWVLFADGKIARFSGGREVAFEITGLDADAVRATQIFTDVETDSLYLVDQANNRIVQIDKREGSEGAFVRQFRYAGSDDFFADIRAVWVSEIDGKLIVLGKDSLRQFVLPKIQDGNENRS